MRIKKDTLNPYFEAELVSYPQAIRSGAGDANYFEPLLEEKLRLLNNIIIELNKLIKAYLALDEEI